MKHANGTAAGIVLLLGSPLAWSAGGPGGGLDVVQEVELEPAVPVLGDKLGRAVALDGNRLAAGRPGSTPMAGAVEVYEDVGAGWVPTATLTGSQTGPDSDFGRALDLEGDTIAVLSENFVLHVFELTGGAWLETARIVPSGNLPDWGLPDHSIDLDGDVIAVAHRALSFQPDDDAVYVYERGPSGWAGATETVLPAPTVVQFANGVSVSGDLLATSDSNNVYLYRRRATGWVAEPPIPEIFPQNFWTVSLDGDRLAVWDTLNDRVDVYAEAGGTWALEAMLVPSNPEPTSQFGRSLELDGDRLLVGAPKEGPAFATSRGAAYLFTRFESSWTEAERFIPDDPVGGMEFGTAVSLDLDRLAVGAPSKDTTEPNTGAAFVFAAVPPVPATYCTAKPTSTGCLPAIGWSGAGASWTGADDFTVLCTDVPSQKSGLFFWGTNGRAALPFLGGTLCVQPGLTRTLPQAAQGSDPCAAAYAFAFTQAYMAQQGLAPCDVVNGQWWMRDPQNPDGTGVALSDGIELEIGL